MNDKKILDRVVRSLEGGYLIYQNGDGRSYSYISCALKDQGGFAPEPSVKETERWIGITTETAEWIKAERAEEELNEKIRKEVAAQIKKSKYANDFDKAVAEKNI